MHGNRHVAVLEQTGIPSGSRLPFYLFEYDTGGYFPALYLTPPSAPGAIGFTAPGFLIDHNGDLIVLGQIIVGPGSPLSPPMLFRATATGGLQGFATLAGTPRHVIQDVDTGDYIVSMDEAVLRATVAGAVLTLATFPPLTRPGVRAQDLDTGEFLLLWGNNMYRLSRTGSLSTTAVTGYMPIAMAVDDRQSAGQRFVFSTGDLFNSYVAKASEAGQVTTLGVFPHTGPPPSGRRLAYASEIRIARGLHLSASSSRLNSWSVLVDFPSDGAMPYAILVGGSGIRPGVALHDGRKIRLVPDAITFIALSGGMPGLSGLSGVLDGRGSAQASIDLSGVPGVQPGTVVWLVAIAFDVGAPSGVRRISEPIVLQVR